MSQQRVDCEFRFHCVGQGLFYTGCVDGFRFVYDCGSDKQTYVEKAVDDYCNLDFAAQSRHVPLLILSHLHHDHVSGVKALLQQVTVETVVLPYLTPWERLLLACAHTDLPQWYIRMLQDPVGFFIEHKVETVILVTHGGEPDGTSRSTPQGHERTNRDPNTDGLIDVPEPRLFEILCEEKDNSEGWRRLHQQGNLAIKTDRGSFYLKELWEFQLYNQTIPEQVIDTFKHCVSKLIVRRGSHEPLLSLLVQESQELRNCYMTLVGGKDKLNFTSLVLWHGPASTHKGRIELGSHCFHSCQEGFLSGLPYEVDLKNDWCPFPVALDTSSALGQLLTSDMNLNHRYEDFRKHFGEKLQSVQLCLVPHHGSMHSWNNNILNDLVSCKAWVVSAGLRNRYHHPHSKVLHDLLRNRDAVCWVNENHCLSLNLTLFI